MNATQYNSKGTTYIVLCKFITVTMVLMILVNCSSSDDTNPNPSQDKGTVTGSVKDENGNSYPNTEVELSNQSEQEMTKTNTQGNFEFNNKGVGSYSVNISPPLSTMVVSQDPLNINIQANQTSTANVVIQPQSIVAHLNLGTVQLLEEIKDKDGNTPTDPNEPLYAANIFDAPLGLLTAINAPDGHHVTLSEFKSANGNFYVHCEGNKAIVDISLEGMIPDGTYTFWLAYLNKTRKVGENIDFESDFVFPTNPPLGSGTANVLIADSNGTITATIEHSSCILTDQVALVIPILYHINGKTFGSGHVPDAEEVVQMLVYFQ